MINYQTYKNLKKQHILIKYHLDFSNKQNLWVGNNHFRISSIYVSKIY